MGPSYIVITRSFLSIKPVYMPLVMPLDILIKPLPNTFFSPSNLEKKSAKLPKVDANPGVSVGTGLAFVAPFRHSEMAFCVLLFF